MCNSRKKRVNIYVLMCVAIVRIAGTINAVCQTGRHICGSGECRVLLLSLLFIVSVDLITVTDGFLIRKV